MNPRVPNDYLLILVEIGNLLIRFQISKQTEEKEKTSTDNTTLAGSESAEAVDNGKLSSLYNCNDTNDGNEKQVRKSRYPSLREQANNRINNAAFSGNYDLAEKHLRILNSLREVDYE